MQKKHVLRTRYLLAKNWSIRYVRHLKISLVLGGVSVLTKSDGESWDEAYTIKISGLMFTQNYLARSAGHFRYGWRG